MDLNFFAEFKLNLYIKTFNKLFQEKLFINDKKHSFFTTTASI